MGYMRHNAIIVTSCLNIDEAHDKAVELFNSKCVTDICPSIVNGYGTFVVVPDGSKEGWDTSDIFDVMRDKFVGWLKDQVYEDGSSPIDWVEVQYGDDNGVTKIIEASK